MEQPLYCQVCQAPAVRRGTGSALCDLCYEAKQSDREGFMKIVGVALCSAVVIGLIFFGRAAACDGGGEEAKAAPTASPRGEDAVGDEKAW